VLGPGPEKLEEEIQEEEEPGPNVAPGQHLEPADQPQLAFAAEVGPLGPWSASLLLHCYLTNLSILL
jgi:hypothetical protein